MRSSSLVSCDDYGVQHSMAFDPWGDISQYTPTPSNLLYPLTVEKQYCIKSQQVAYSPRQHNQNHPNKPAIITRSTGGNTQCCSSPPPITNRLTKPSVIGRVRAAHKPLPNSLSSPVVHKRATRRPTDIFRTPQIRMSAWLNVLAWGSLGTGKPRLLR